ESALTYTWSITSKPAGAPDPTFSINGTNAAKNTTVTFSRAGDYAFQVVLSNGTLSTTASIAFTVSQTLTSLTITPSYPTMSIGATQQINASGLDQFGQAITPVPALDWSVEAGGGSIDPSGLYDAPSHAGT